MLGPQMMRGRPLVKRISVLRCLCRSSGSIPAIPGTLLSRGMVRSSAWLAAISSVWMTKRTDAPATSTNHGIEMSAMRVLPERGGAQTFTSRTRSSAMASKGAMKCREVVTSKRPLRVSTAGRVTLSAAHS